MSTDVLDTVKPKTRDSRPVLERARELIRRSNEAAKRRVETVVTREGNAIVFRKQRIA